MTARTIAGLAVAYRQRRLSPVEVVSRSLAASELAGRTGRGAWCELHSERALDAAAVAEREISSGVWRGPLHGVPFGVKDVFHVQGSVTAAGVDAYADRVRREGLEPPALQPTVG